MTLNPHVQFRVYTPHAGKRWSLYQAPLLLVPFAWFAMLLRGLWSRVAGPPRGRAVTLEDMKPHHPGKPHKCLCRGSGLIVTVQGGAKDMRFCAAMKSAFKAHAGWRVVDVANKGPHWIRGYAPEELIGDMVTR